MTEPTTQSAAVELKACPFCGGEANWVEDNGDFDTPFGLVTEHAETCFLGQRMMAEWDNIITAWNTRAPIAPATGAETWESIAKWCEATFGPCTASRMTDRAAEEMQELRDETLIAVNWTDKARIEAADVLICLSRVPDIWAAVEQKMAINRARKWKVGNDGTGYHVRGTDAGEPSA